MTQPQPVAEPAEEPQAALIATCQCGRRITRLALDSAKWRHDDQSVTCAPVVGVEEAPEGAPGMGAVQAWFRNGGRDDPPFDDLVKGGQP